jgi:hypothetical protein
MKATLVFAALSLLHTLTLALTPYSAKYSVTMLGIKIGTEYRTLKAEDGRYYYQSSIKTNNIGKSLYKDLEFSAESVFSVNHSGITPFSYREKNIEDGNTKKDINIDLKNREFDRLSIFFALPNVIINNPTKTNFYFKVDDGKNIKTHSYQIKTNNKDYVEVVEKDKKIEIKFSKKMNYFPTYFKIKNISSRLEKFN